MDKMNVSLIEGKLPEAGTNQIVIHKSIAANKKLKIGDYDYYKQKNTNVNSGFVFEKDAYDFDESGDGTLYQVYSYEKEAKDINNYGKILRISMAVLSAFIYVIVGFMIMFMGYVFYNGRKAEFGILNAIGYDSRFLLRRSLKEIWSIVISGAVFGVIIGMAVGEILNVSLFNKLGQVLEVFNFSYLLKPAILIMIVVLVLFIIVCKIINSVDCIALIEGEN